MDVISPGPLQFLTVSCCAQTHVNPYKLSLLGCWSCEWSELSRLREIFQCSGCNVLCVCSFMQSSRFSSLITLPKNLVHILLFISFVLQPRRRRVEDHPYTAQGYESNRITSVREEKNVYFIYGFLTQSEEPISPLIPHVFWYWQTFINNAMYK